MKVKNKVKERKDSNERERESFFCCGRSHMFMVDSCVKVKIILLNLMKFQNNAFLVVL